MKLVLHPLFIVTVIIGVCAGFGPVIAAMAAAVLVHEFSHVWAASRFGIVTNRVRLLPFGGEINIDCAFLGVRERVLILLAGSFGNIAAALVSSSFLWFFPDLFFIFEYFIIANAVPAVLNLLPIYPLDGGKILHLLFSGEQKPKRNIGLVMMLRLVSNAAVLALLVAGCFAAFNLPLILFCAVMLCTINIEMKKSQFTSKLFKSVKIGKGAVKERAVSSDMTLLSVYKLVSPRYYAKFIITDRGNTVFYENELEGFLLSNSLDKQLKDVIKPA